jgi:hypothetical protein
MNIFQTAQQAIAEFENFDDVPFQRVSDRDAEIATFFSHCRLAENGCWIWTGKTTTCGYGIVGRDKLAHRLSHRLFKGEIPNGLWVLHSCDNPPCVNPAHLRAGTRQENVDDCIARGRFRKSHGALNNLAKLTDADIIDIRNSTLSPKVLSAKYGIDRTNVNYIIRGKTWTHVPMPARRVEKADGRAKLTHDQVRAIRAADASTPYSELASQYGVGIPLISMIRNGRIWKSVAAQIEERI